MTGVQTCAFRSTTLLPSALTLYAISLFIKSCSSVSKYTPCISIVSLVLRRYKIFDINKGLEEQGMNEGEYDIIVSSNVMHVAKNGTTAFQKVKKLLNPEGYIVTIDAVNESPILLISMAFLYLIDIQDERKEKEQIFFDLKHYYRNFGTINADVLYEFPSEKDKLQFLNQKLCSFRTERVCGDR